MGIVERLTEIFYFFFVWLFSNLQEPDEQELLAWVFLSWRLGFPCTRDDLKAQACKFMRAAGREPHGDMEHWLTSFYIATRTLPRCYMRSFVRPLVTR